MIHDTHPYYRSYLPAAAHSTILRGFIYGAESPCYLVTYFNRMSNATVDLLPASLQNTLHQIVDRVNASTGGLRVILLSTAEGVPLGRVYADNNSPLNEDVLSSIESTWAPASKQFPLLNMGKEVKTVTAIYDHGKLGY